MVNFASPLVNDQRIIMEPKPFKQLFETFLKRRKDLKLLGVEDSMYD